MKIETMASWLAYSVSIGGVLAGLIITIMIKWKGELRIIEPNTWILSLEFALFAFGLLWLLGNAERFK